MKYIIGSGWWCDGSGIHTHSNHQKSVDKETRQKNFFNIWHYAINQYTSPTKVFIIDSNSPVKPDFNKNELFFHSLDKNYGAGLDGTRNQRLSGWDRSILLSASMAFFEDVDYYVYIEQDCLIYGKGIIEECIKKMGNKKIMYGGGKGTPQPLQQSLIIIKKDYIPFFLYKESTNSFENLKLSAEQRHFNHYNKDIIYCPFGYGRQRPINFNDKYFYAQHLNTQELKQFKEKINYEK